MDYNRQRARILWAVLAMIIIITFSFGKMFSERRLAARAIEAMSWVVAGHTIIIDPGHGGEDPGKVSPTGIYEKDINLALAKKLTVLFSQGGAQVIMTRSEDKALSNNEDTLRERKRADLNRRLELVQEAQADFFISLHCNSFPDGRWSGAQTFYAPHLKGSQALAGFIQEELIKLLGNTTRKPKADTTSFLFKHSKIPVVNVEMGFLSNPAEEKLLLDESYQDKLAWAIYAGTARYLSENDNYTRQTLRKVIK